MFEPPRIITFLMGAISVPTISMMSSYSCLELTKKTWSFRNIRVSGAGNIVLPPRSMAIGLKLLPGCLPSILKIR